MIVPAAVALLLVNVQFSHSCDGEGDILICMNFPLYFRPGYSTLVMYLRDSGEINNTVFRSDNLTSVTRLRLDSAGITGIAEGAFASFRNLSSLSLQNNALTRVSAGWLGRPAVLCELSLAGNQMGAVDESMLRGLVGLTKLHLNNNNIGTIAPDAFRSQTSLAELDLSDNRLTRISTRVFRFFMSTRIRLHRNPWDCSCEAEESVDSLRELWSRSLLDVQMDVTCASPPPLTGAPVWNVSDVCAPAPSGVHSTRAVTSASQPPPETNASVRPTDTVTAATLNTATSSPLTQTSVYPKPDATVTVSPSDDVTGPPSRTGCTLTVVITAVGLWVLLFAAGLLVVLHRRKRKNKAVIPARPNRDGNTCEDGGAAGQRPLPGPPERSDPGTAERRPFTGARAKSANAVLSRSSFRASRKDQAGLRKETEAQAEETGRPAEGKRDPANEAQGEADQAEGLSNTELVVESETRADPGKGLGENLQRASEPVPYLSIGPNPDEASQLATDAPGPRSTAGNVIGRISTWPPTAVQWRARCKLGGARSDDVTGWAQNVTFKFSSETQNKAEHPSVCGGARGEEDGENSPGLQQAPSATPAAVNDAHVTLGNASNPNDEIASSTDAHDRSDVMPGEKSSQDLAAGRRTRAQIHNRNEEAFGNPCCKPAGDPARRPTGKSTGSKAPSGGTSPDDTLRSGNEFAFMDLLHEVVQNNGRWTRERWKQIHVNKQRR